MSAKRELPMTDLREHLVRLLEWEDAHVSFDAIVEKMPVPLRNQRPEGVPHSMWELLEHLRLAQRDILEFCVDPAYKERRWPDDYWPKPEARATTSQWNASIRAILADRKALVALASDESIDLFAKIPHGSGQTYLRELLLVADHNAYHVGQLAIVRRALGAWPAE